MQALAEKPKDLGEDAIAIFKGAVEGMDADAAAELQKHWQQLKDKCA